MTIVRLPSIRAPIIALLVFETFALTVRAALQLELQDRNVEEQLAYDLSFFIVPPILGVCCWPIALRYSPFLKQVLNPGVMSWRVIFLAICIGLSLRLVWWGQLFARIGLGLQTNNNPDAITGPLISFQCPPAPNLALYLLVTATLVPLLEEIINRGFFLAGLLRFGRWPAALGSSVLFAVYHTPDAIINAFVIGLLLAALTLSTGSLWPSIVAHATYNGLIALDWHCLNTIWNPTTPSPKLVAIGIGAVILTLLLMSVTVWLAWRQAPMLIRTPAPAEPR